MGLAVLDKRLDDEEMVALVGSSEHGSPSLYQIKQLVRAIKQLAHEFAQRQRDEHFSQAMDDEAAVHEKRFGGRVKAGV